MSETNVRVRFAPSPTGPLHMGGVRTALFNYLFARQNNGTFILRIEDTDQNRYVEGAEEYIMQSLDWCGISPDEGIKQGGDFGPYRQSERKDLYKKYAIDLIETGNAYYAFDTPEALEAMREKLQAEKSDIQHYGPLTRGGMENSLTLVADEVKTRLERGDNYVIRFKMPEDYLIETIDIIRGDVKVKSALLDDKVLFKSDGMPTYHLANVVDDYLMKISHVIRGEEWLPSLPLHVMLYKSFGWEKQMPQFAHLPLLLKPNGKGKLSKRDGDKLGFPVFPLEWTDPKSEEKSMGYREQGYFPEAFVNMLALLGWNSGTDQEVFSLEELVAAFDLMKSSKSGAKFDPEKAKWFNQQYLRKIDDEKLAHLFQQWIADEKKQIISIPKLVKVVSLVKERATFVTDLWEQSSFFFEAPREYEAKAVKKRWKADSGKYLSDIVGILAAVEDFTSENTETAVKEYLEANEIGFGPVMNPFRLALVGDLKGPHLFDIAEIIGKEETIARIDKAIEKLG